MGVFDTIQLKGTCPVCTKNHNIEIQTKDLDPSMKELKEGDQIGTLKFRYLDGIMSCDENFMDIKIKLDKDKITNQISIKE
jgi:hypothetical protein